MSEGDFIGNGRYRLILDQPIPQFDTVVGKAYAAADRDDPAAALYTLVMPGGMPYRHRVLEQLMQRPCAGLVNPLAVGMIGERGQRRTAIVFDRPEGGNLGQPSLKIPEAQLIAEILPPLFDAIEAMATRQVTHRTIRPDKIFFQDAERTRAVFGECISVTAGADQPSVFETIERAMATPEGRGEGTTGTDLYALGVCIASLVLGIDPTAIPGNIAARTIYGSYTVLIGLARLMPRTEALLRGLLADDPTGRWGLEEVQRWRSGVSQTPRQRGIGRRAPHGYSFMGSEWRMPRLLAQELSSHRHEAVLALREPGLTLWVRHALGDALMAEEIADAVQMFQDGPGDLAGETLLISRVCRALDPSGPLRFRELAFMEDGVGTTLAQTFVTADRQRMKVMSDLFTSPLLVEATSAGAETATLARPFVLSLQSWARDPAPGTGLERCLYELLPKLGCLSPHLQGEGYSIPAIMRALDSAAEADVPPQKLFDRHLAAFLASRSRMLERRVQEIARVASDPLRSALAIMTLLGELQEQSKIGPLRGLTAWAAARLVPCVKALRRASARKELLEELNALGAEGDLHRMMHELDLQGAMRSDSVAFYQAAEEYKRLGRQIEAIAQGESARLWLASEHGQWISALIAIVCLGVSLGSVVLQVL